jgi:carbamate kinase
MASNSSKSMVVVVALGGNAIMSKGDTGSAQQQSQRIHEATEEIAKLVVAGCTVILTHGNGPQVGAIQKQQEIARDAVPPFPLDLCGAETQGWIGYVIQRELQNHLRRLGSDKEVVTLVTEIEVDRKDEAFQHPTKPIGAFLTKEGAVRILSLSLSVFLSFYLSLYLFLYRSIDRSLSSFPSFAMTG